MNLTAGTLALSPGLTTGFLAGAGTPPYTYSVLPGGAGGTIDSSGVYTAPGVYGGDTVQAIDSLGAIAQLDVLIGTSVELFADIIRKEMGLSDDQVFLWDQKYTIPNDSRIYVALAVTSCKPFGNTNRSDGSGSGLDAIQSVNMLAKIDINLFSRSLDAVNRKEEVVLALNSVYARQQQEINSFAVALLPIGFVDLSNVEGAAIPYRFVISVNMQYIFRKTKAVAYYDDFPGVTVTTEP